MHSDRTSMVDVYDDELSNEEPFLKADVRKKKFSSLFPAKQNVSIVLAETSAAYCLKFLNEEKVHSVPVLDRSLGANRVIGLVDVMDVCSFVTNQYYQKQNLDGWDVRHFKFVIEASLKNHSSKDLIDISDNNHLKLLKTESATFYDVLDTLATQGYSRVILLGSKGLFESSHKRHLDRIVTRSDILKFVQEKAHYYDFHVILSKTLAELLLEKHMVTVRDDSPTIDAFRTMIGMRVHALPVVNAEGILVGNLSVRDVEASFNDKTAELSLPVGEYLAAIRKTNVKCPDAVATCKPSDTVRDAITFMIEKHIHRVWLVDSKGVPTGVFSATDVCRLFAHEPKELKELKEAQLRT